jgi:hypothetical protein
VTRDRFEELAEAYGGDVARWPSETRDQAAVLMASDPAFTQGVLARAAGLDETLDAFAFIPASRALTERIVASAPAARARRPWRAWLLPAGLTAGMAAVCAAGVMVGAQAAPPAATDGGDTVTSAAVELDVSGLPEEA